MKIVILAGGLGTRLAEETEVKPKPMIEIGGLPVLWHVMKIYASFGFNDFVICLGYKGYLIKEYFANYFLHRSDVTFDLQANKVEIHDQSVEPWRVTLVDTGATTQTGGRIKRIQKYVGNEDFCMTYGDGVGDINVRALVDYHKAHGKLATVTATRNPGRFGALVFSEGDQVQKFEEKPDGDGGWINGGFFVLNPSVFDYIEGDATVWERGPLEGLAKNGQLRAYRHQGFWQPMDTLRDKNYLENLWAATKAPWKVWD